MAFAQNLVRCTINAAVVKSARSLSKNASNFSLLQRCINLKPITNQHCLRTFSVGTQLHQDVNVTFLRANGQKIQTKGKVGDTLLDVVVNNHIDLDGFGACEGTLTCSTCHLIFKTADFEKLPDKASDEELDMLDLAYELTETSRLGCQITLTKDMDGLVVSVPATINDARSA
ncbi:adrenodoxin-like protein 2, mitochondrial [Bactrocera dorsalis]|uniref:Adrenodoxin-like protein 2, mitochondrial n=1 Tax=Bactrocera dorsalis TaxID=27457 RepID=A0A8N4L9C0_BACDO|nr:adrenodoxin-like protein 2, mitochondrial [Bactrocera dorsalis]